MRESAGLNQRLVGAHNGTRQSVLGVIVHAARIELHNAVIAVAIIFARRTAPQMHDAAVDAVPLNQSRDMMNKFVRFEMLQRRVLQKQIVRGIGAVH